jgi:hypothetical protein
MCFFGICFIHVNPKSQAIIPKLERRQSPFHTRNLTTRLSDHSCPISSESESCSHHQRCVYQSGLLSTSQPSICWASLHVVRSSLGLSNPVVLLTLSGRTDASFHFWPVSLDFISSRTPNHHKSQCVLLACFCMKVVSANTMDLIIQNNII